MDGAGRVMAVHRDGGHHFSKRPAMFIRLIAGYGVEGDAHGGATVQHRSRVAKDPTQPNLRQVHLIQADLHTELRARGFDVGAGQMGENITTEGLDLLALPEGTRLAIGGSAVIELTGLRNPCGQIERFRPGLLQAVLGRDGEGNVVRKAGVMAVVLAGGDVQPGDAIAVTLPDGPYRALAVV